MNIKNKINAALTKISNNLSQTGTDRSGVEPIITEGMPELIRSAAAEGAVLLENDGTLPFAEGTKLSLFGTTCSEWFYVGYGSGGDVNNPYQISLTDAVRNCDKLELDEELAEKYALWLEKNPVSEGIWGHWILHNPEMPIDEETVSDAANNSDAAVITIGRSSGEDRDSKYENGSYFLSDDEVKMLDLVTAHFDKVVVLLNVGSIIDMSWVKHYDSKLSTVMYVWQGGMESGNAVCDLLCGQINPSGKLTDTIAKKYSDYPSSANFGNKDFINYEEDIFVGYRYFETFDKDAVLYPFGYGLSYTDFDIEHISTVATDNGFMLTAKVTNTGTACGKETVQIYLEKPCGKLGNPKMVLAGFAKTKELSPNESEKIKIAVNMYQLSSYDDCGSTNNASAYVIEQGEYKLYIGKNVRENKHIFTYYQKETVVYEQLKQAAAPQEDFEVFHAEEIGGEIINRKKKAAKQKYDLATRIINNKPENIRQTGDRGYKLKDVKDGKVTMEQFTAQLTIGELEAISRGDYEMNSPLGADGNAGVFGGVLQSLRDKGVPAITTTDGPSGIRLSASCSLLPIGTLLACTFNTELVEKLYSSIASEMKDRGSDVLLAPGMNIHRNPLCGRNFEYYSEDPYLTGKIGAAAVLGIQSEGASACPKHFACNNQEFRRNTCDSRLSERALREIYLKGFEICIKESKPKNIMTSYNKINGVWGHYNYDLCTTILRGEWNYEGNVMTDWWMRKSKSPEFPNLRDQAYRVRAQVDLLMPGGERVTNHKPDGTLLKTYGLPDGITLGEMQRCAMNILNAVINIKL
ncbi:MAG: glycoside hydrolase family 3 protein [Eubacterium sp.]